MESFLIIKDLHDAVEESAEFLALEDAKQAAKRAKAKAYITMNISPNLRSLVAANATAKEV